MNRFNCSHALTLSEKRENAKSAKFDTISNTTTNSLNPFSREIQALLVAVCKAAVMVSSSTIVTGKGSGLFLGVLLCVLVFRKVDIV